MTDLEDDYHKAGFGGRLSFGRSPALLIVDVCRAYLDPACPLYAGQSAVAAMGRNIELADAARRYRIPVFFTRVEYDAEGTNGGVFFRKVPALRNFVRGSALGDFVPELSPRDGDIVITKQYPSAFFGTSLSAQLDALKIDTAIVTGYSTSGCVRATALDAMQYGFVPFVVSDACADRAPAPHESNLFDLQSKYAEVVTTETILGLMKGGAST